MKTLLKGFGACIAAALLFADAPVQAAQDTLMGGAGGYSVTGGGGGGPAFTFDPVQTAGHSGTNATFANSYRDMTGSNSGFSTARTTTAISGSSKVCAEFTLVSPAGTPLIGVGFGDGTFNENDYLGHNDASNMLWLFNNSTFNSGSFTLANSSAVPTAGPSANDLYMICVDYAGKKAYLARNGTFAGGQAPGSNTSPWLTWTSSTLGPLYFGASYGSGQTGVLRLAATGTAPPSGFTLLNQ